MKAKYSLVLVLAVAMIASVGCFKVTGGGWFYCEGHKITFGFNAQPTEDGAKGQFQLIDHGTKTKIHGVFTGTPNLEVPGISQFFGDCRVNGMDGYSLAVTVLDNDPLGTGIGDWIEVSIQGPDNYYYAGTLEGGNVKVHTKGKKK